MSDRLTLRVEISASPTGCVGRAGQSCLHLSGAECGLFNRYLRLSSDGRPLRCAPCMDHENTDRIPPVYEMEIDELEDVPVARGCVIVSVDEYNCGVIVSDPADGENPRRALAALIISRENVENVIESLRDAVAVCQKREVCARRAFDD